MKRFLLFLAFAMNIALLTAQDIDKSAAMQLVIQNNKSLGLSSQELKDVKVSNAYVSNPSKLQLVYLQQTHEGVPVYNKIKVLAFKEGKLVSNAGSHIPTIEKRIQSNATPVVTAENAVRTAIADKKLTLKYPLRRTNNNSAKPEFGKLGVSYENISAELMWVPVEEGKKVKLAWQVYLVPVNSSDYWLIRIDAVNNNIIEETNLTVYCSWEDPSKPKGLTDKHAHKDDVCFTEKIKTEISTDISIPQFLAAPDIVNSATYRVIPFPAESPKHPGGAHVLRTDPWTAAPGNATSLKWHSTGGVDYNYTRGNNVWAQEDLNANNGTGIPATSTTPADPLSFDFVPNYNAAPTQTTPAPNQQFNITNLFYWNNVIHDVLYQYGFDEPAGNFQANNQGRGGQQNDFVYADAQDGNYIAPNQNNANFATPADGGNPRMQMYLWDSIRILTVNSPAPIAGYYQAIESNFSSANKLINVGPVTGQVAYFNDNAGGTTHEGCVPANNSLAGKIALIIRGNCDFVVKVKNAQNAGAIGVIMVNNVAGAPIIMGGGDNSITIPAMMVSMPDGALFAAQLANNLNVTLAAPLNADGSVDNGVVVHEFAHGISNRLTGGPAQSGCVSNAEHMGEGWSDYYGLMLTQDWANSTLNTGFTTPRAMGTYASGQGPNGAGIRTQRYSTDFSVNNLVYTAALPGTGMQHTRGELWAATLWDMTWNIINQVGSITPDIYNASGNGGNIIALKLVTEGMKLQPCGPGFIDGRDAILQADQILYGGQYSCAIKEAFRRRGMGPFASQGSANNASDQIPDFTSSLSVSIKPDVTEAGEGQNIVYTATVTTCSAVTNYTLTDTLPANVTYVSGGTYNAGTRVVSFPVNLTPGQTQTYTFTVSVNTGAFYPTSTLLSETFAGATLPGTMTTTSSTSTLWTVVNTQSQSAPNSAFSASITTPSDQVMATTNNYVLNSNPAQLVFDHLYNTESGYDGGVIEISTNNGTTWTDLGNSMFQHRYNSQIDAAAGTAIAGRQAFSGLSNGFKKTSINLAPYVNQSAKFRWRFVSDDGTSAVGWYVDDIILKSQPLVIMRANLISPTNVRTAYADTVTVITQTVTCNNVAITTQPANVNGCVGSNVTFTAVATGTTPTYQWQVSTNGGTSYTNITGATSATLTLNAITAGLNDNRYRVVVSNTCPSTVTSTAAVLTVNTPAAITTQASNVTVCAGANASFTVVATGSSNTYQWQVSSDNGTTWSNVAGATTTTLNLNAVTTAMNGNQYRLVITSCSATPLNSSVVTLTVNGLAAITTQPTNTNACTGGNATISVTATGSALGYQWQVSTDGGTTWSNITGATSATLNLTGVTSAMNNNRYRVIVSNSCPSTVTSSAVTLTVSNPATITSQPTASTVCAGSNATFTVVAAGTAVTYQWQVSTDGGSTFTNVTGATSATLTLNAVTAAMNNNRYRVTVLSCDPTGLNSNAVTLTVNSPAVITSQPANSTVCTGDNTSFSVTATGTTVGYQWQLSTDGGTTFTNIAGATNNTYNLVAVTGSMNNNRYRVVLSNVCTASLPSSAAVLTVSAATSIATQPTDDVVCSGNAAIFTASASGSATYQWQVSTNGGTSWSDVAGATSATLNIPAVTVAMNGNAHRVVATGCGSVNSNAATLTVNASPVVTISASPYVRITPDLTTTITASSTPAASVYTWYRNGSVLTGATGNNITVAYVNGLGDYSASVVDINGCAGNSNVVTIEDSTVLVSFIYPNPNEGTFKVRFNNPTGTVNTQFIVVYDSKGSRVYMKAYAVSLPYEIMDVDIRHLSAGTYMLALTDAKGNKIAQGKVIKN